MMLGRPGPSGEKILGIVTVLRAAFLCAQLSYRLRGDAAVRAHCFGGAY
jgi:hypothetical protein